MPEYFAPGVYVEEIELGGKPVEGVSTSTVGFLGQAERGPTTPTFITSWLDYQRVYGGIIGENQYLPFAVKGFFDNGGKRCYIGRITKVGSVKATLSLKDAADKAGLTVKAVGEGDWGNRIAVHVLGGSLRGFKINVSYWKQQMPEAAALFDPAEDSKKTPRPTVVEVFDNVSVDSASPDYYGIKVNGISNLIVISKEAADTGENPKPNLIAPLAGGLDKGTDGTTVPVIADFEGTGTSKPDSKGLNAFKEIDEISIVYAPNSQFVPGLTTAIINHCANLKDRITIIDSQQGAVNASSVNPREDTYDSMFAAYYYPWIKIVHPTSGNTITVPPGGHVAGIFARSDAERGVHKAPANEVVRGAVDVEFQITMPEQEILNPRGVNVIRSFPGRGIRVWGARTLSSDPSWKYVNVRRLFNYLEESIDEGTQWVVFEPNDEKLWARVRRTLNEFLTRVWRDGALMGTKQDQAFFVRVDRTTMTQDDIDNGKLIVLVGVAPVKPAEFVIFRIAQVASGSDISEA